MAIQRCASRPCGGDHGFRRVALPNEDMKGRIIGREGRNIRTLETVDRRRSHHRRYAGGHHRVRASTPCAARLRGLRWKSSSPTAASIRRASRTWSKRPRSEVDHTIQRGGRAAPSSKPNMHGLHPELVKLLGRHEVPHQSYGQNVLKHSIEVSHLAGLMAGGAGRGRPAGQARRPAARPRQSPSTTRWKARHVQLGVELARKYQREARQSSTAIEAHHNDVEPQTVDGRAWFRRPTPSPPPVPARAARTWRTTSAVWKSWRRLDRLLPRRGKVVTPFRPAARCASWSSRRMSPTRTT